MTQSVQVNAKLPGKRRNLYFYVHYLGQFGNIKLTIIFCLCLGLLVMTHALRHPQISKSKTNKSSCVF